MQNLSFEELSAMPMQCYGCGKPLRHLSIVEALSGGKSLRETMDELNYQRLCCRQVIQTQPSIVSLRKRLQSDQNIDQQLSSGLTLEATGPIGATIAPRGGGLQIVDEAPPGMEQTNTLFPGGAESFMEDAHINPFEYFVQQLEAPDGEDSPT